MHGLVVLHRLAQMTSQDMDYTGGITLPDMTAFIKRARGDYRALWALCAQILENLHPLMAANEAEAIARIANSANLAAQQRASLKLTEDAAKKDGAS